MASFHAAAAAARKTATATGSDSTTSSAELDFLDGPTLTNSSESLSRQRQDERLGIHKLAMLQRQANFSTPSISTYSSSSTIPGVGMLSGRVIKRVGQAIIHFAEEPIIWRRLRTIRRQFENEVLRIELLSDAKNLYSVLFDLSELRISSLKSGHSVHGYPKRVANAAFALHQQIMSYIWTASDKPWITNKMAKSILFCFCEVYWSQEDSEMLLHVVKQIFKLLDSRKDIDLKNQTFLERGVLVLCDFAASCPYYLLRSDSSSTLRRAFDILSQMKPDVISDDVHCRTLELGYHNLMLTLKRGNVAFGYEDAILENTAQAFEPLVAEQIEYDIHITSLLCACISRMTQRLRLEFGLSGHSLRYPFEMYDVVLPLKEVMIPINIAFIDALIKDITEISDSIGIIAVQVDDKQHRARRAMAASLKRLAQSTRKRAERQVRGDPKPSKAKPGLAEFKFPNSVPLEIPQKSKHLGEKLRLTPQAPMHRVAQHSKPVSAASSSNKLEPVVHGFASENAKPSRNKDDITAPTRLPPRSDGEPFPRRSRLQNKNATDPNGALNVATAGTTPLRDMSTVREAIGKTIIVHEDGQDPVQFKLGNCIGVGQFGIVYRALDLTKGQMVAVKRMDLKGLSEREIQQLMKEVDMVKSLSHPSIVKYEGLARDHDTLNIVLEYAENGSLGQTLRAFGKLNERLAASYVVKILEGLHYLHSSDVVHCDLKAANILTTKNGNIKLSDFGVSFNLRKEKDGGIEVAGTPNWMAPEVIELKGATKASDIWSLGCVIIELITGKPPYSEMTNGMSVMYRIVEDQMPPLPEICSDVLKDFLRLCFQKDPTKRPTAVMLCEHEWLKKNWGSHRELRPQDSIPFLKRISGDVPKSYHAISQSGPASETAEAKGGVSASSRVQRRRAAGVHAPMPSAYLGDKVTSRGHSFVELASFGDDVTCRVCLKHVEKSPQICEDCSFISHSTCVGRTDPTCGLHYQILENVHVDRENYGP